MSSYHIIRLLSPRENPEDPQAILYGSWKNNRWGLVRTIEQARKMRSDKVANRAARRAPLFEDLAKNGWTFEVVRVEESVVSRSE